MSVIPEKYADLLNSTVLVHVATIGPKGEPQNNPVWFGWDGTHLLFSQTKGRQLNTLSIFLLSTSPTPLDDNPIFCYNALNNPKFNYWGEMSGDRKTTTNL